MISFLIESIMLGGGLAMDAFSVSLANGLHDPQMKTGQRMKIAGTFAFFQFLMPITGWLCIHTIVETFTVLQPVIPWVGFLLLLYIGGKMLIEGIKEMKTGNDEREGSGDTEGVEGESGKVSNGLLFVQGIATSIDALSVGFAIADYYFLRAFGASVIIAAVTLIICLAGLAIGRRFGMKYAGRASLLGGLILIGIGVSILVRAYA